MFIGYGLILVSSITLYCLLFRWTKQVISKYCSKRCEAAVQNEISMRVVSSIQAILACACGGLIMKQCCMDKLHARSWLVEPYGFSMTGYLWYDTWAMFESYRSNRKINGQYQGTVKNKLVKFLCADPAMMIHHLLLPVLLIPVLVFYRRGIGDFYIGMFLLIEAFIPFASFREILVLLNKKHTLLYIINGIFTAIVYTLCRICIFPFMMWTHGLDIGQPFYSVPWYIPRICSVGTVGLLSLFLYWWGIILKIMYAELYELRYMKIRDTTIEDVSNSHGEGHVNTVTCEKKSD